MSREEDPEATLTGELILLRMTPSGARRVAKALVDRGWTNVPAPSEQTYEWGCRTPHDRVVEFQTRVDAVAFLAGYPEATIVQRTSPGPWETVEEISERDHPGEGADADRWWQGDQPTETRGGGAQGGEELSENSRDGDEPGSAVVGAGHGTTTPANSPRPDQPDVWRENGRWCWRSLPGGEAEATEEA